MSALGGVEFGPEMSERRVIFWACQMWRDSDYMRAASVLHGMSLILKPGRAEDTAAFLADILLIRGER
jgi:hypothetical protein